MEFCAFGLLKLTPLSNIERRLKNQDKKCEETDEYDILRNDSLSWEIRARDLSNNQGYITESEDLKKCSIYK